MKNVKNKLFLATAIIALAACSDNTYMGENEGGGRQNEYGAITFGGTTGKLTRATSNTGSVAEMLGGQMKIYGVKKVTSGPVYTTVFDNYQLWSSNTTTTSNYDSDWEYVGDAGGHGSYVNSSSVTITPTVTLSANQYIKYWDWATNEYHFVAGSPVSNFTYTITEGEIASASVTGINGHINPNTGAALSKDPVYIAAPVKKVNGTDYNTDVEFSFTRQQTYVRVGVYETIPGYDIISIDFYEWDKSSTNWKASPQNTHNIVLNSKTNKYFKGGAATATVTYEWGTPSISSIAYSTAPVEQESWYGGKLDLSASNPLAKTSTTTPTTYFYGTDSDIDANGYFTVLPTPSGTDAQPIIIKCDYVLKAIDGAETIKVSGATAAIPAAFCKWNPNTTYTYLFKISDNTNGKTDPSQTSEGLFPVTFDAVVVAEASGTEQGTITSVSTPSITTYQEGSVIATGIKYVKDKAIYFTAQNDETGDLNSLSALTYGTPTVGAVSVYKLDGAATEADLILTRPASGKIFTTTIGAAAWEINGQSVAASKWASFTPDAAGYYAIEYTTVASPAAAYAYKIVYVAE